MCEFLFVFFFSVWFLFFCITNVEVFLCVFSERSAAVKKTEYFCVSVLKGLRGGGLVDQGYQGKRGYIERVDAHTTLK